MLWRTLLLFVILHIAAIAGILLTLAPAVTAGDPQAVTVLPWLIGLFAGVVAFTLLRDQKRLTPSLIIVAVAAEGLFLGGIATYFEGRMPGVVLQVAFAALSVVVAFLPLAATVQIRRLRRGARTLLFVAGGYAVFMLHNLTLMEMDFIPEQTAWGQGATSVLGAPLGLILAALIVPSLAYTLARTVEHTEAAANERAPAHHAWQAGLNVMALILWHIVETPRSLVLAHNAAEEASGK
nr:Bax inhibitor-1/YccA family protein [Brachybacterium fresconis]